MDASSNQTGAEQMSKPSTKTQSAVAKYGAAACRKAFELSKSGEGPSSIMHGFNTGFAFRTVGQVDAAINAGRELAGAQ